MREALANNICRYRKEKGYTQDELGKILGLSFQAISKWETGQALPDITLLPEISKVFEISIDKLLGYPNQDKQVTIYEEVYKTEEYYWGVTPSMTCLKILELLPPSRHLKLLDIGCGEGKDAVFFAKNGYDVTAFDISDAGLKKTEQLAKNFAVNINVFKADILDFRLDERFDILYSSGVFHYIKPELRSEIISNYMEYTNSQGINTINVFVKKPFISKPPENEPTASDWISGELLTHYKDWHIESFQELIFDCSSSGIAHKHAMNEIIARKI